MADEKLVHAHELFLGQIETVFGAEQASPDLLARVCNDLARIIIPPNCLPEVEKTLIGLLVCNREIDEAPPEIAWAKVGIMRRAIGDIQARQRQKAKPPKKKPQRDQGASPTRTITQSAEDELSVRG